MITLLFKTVLSLFPFIREIVNSHQQGPRDRRTKNPLTPWLVIALVYIVAFTTCAGSYIIELLDKEQKYNLENTKLSHLVQMSEDVRNENLELRKQLRAVRDQLIQVTDARDSLLQKNADLRDENDKQSDQIDLLTSQNNQLTTEVARLTERLGLCERPPIPQQRVVVEAPRVEHRNKPSSGRSKELLNKLMQ